MKKFIAIIVGVILTIGTSALVSSCQKDIAVAKSLIGTAWLCSNQTGTEKIDLTFTSQTECKMIYNETVQVKAVYVITGSKGSLAGCAISISPLAGQDGHTSTLTGEFETENKLVLDGMIYNRVLL